MFDGKMTGSDPDMYIKTLHVSIQTGVLLYPLPTLAKTPHWYANYLSIKETIPTEMS